MTSKVKWKGVEGYEEYYQVSTEGRIRSLRRETLLNPAPSADGYLYVNLTNDSGRKTLPVQRIVATAFVEKSHPTKDRVFFLDYNKSNCNADNLQWGTRKDIMDHNDLVSTRATTRSMTDKEVHRAIKMRQKGRSITVIAAKLNVGNMTISRILSGETYQHITKGNKVRVKQTTY